MEKILVTGGAGFIGSNFVHYFLNNFPDYEIVNLDKLTYAGSMENLADLRGERRHYFIRGDICNAQDVRHAMKGCSAVIHFAAESHVDRSIESSSEFLETNILGTKVLLDQAREQNIEKFVHISTDEVYGSVEKGRSKETDSLKPRNPYSASKAAAEMLAMSYYNTYDLPVVVTRSSNNFGPYQFPEKVIPLFITNLIEGKKVPLYGDGKNKRDWLYVEDNCSAISLVLEKGKAGQVYNIGAGNEKTNIEMTEFLLKELGKNKDDINYVKDRPGHDRRYALNVSKIKKLGWRPYYRFEDAMKKTIEWYRENENWWAPLKVK